MASTTREDDLDHITLYSFYQFREGSPLGIHLKHIMKHTIFPLWHLNEQIISELIKKKMYHASNPKIIVFTEKFKKAFGCKAIHVENLSRVVLSHLTMVKSISVEEYKLPIGLYKALDLSERDVNCLSRPLTRANYERQNVRQFTVKKPFLNLLRKVALPNETAPFSIATLYSLFLRYLTEKIEKVENIYVFDRDPIKRVLNLYGIHESQTISLLQRELRYAPPAKEE